MIAEFTADGKYVRDVLKPPAGEVLGAKPFSTGTPLGIGVGPDGSVYYADIGIVVTPDGIGPGDGTGTGAAHRVRRVGQPAAAGDDGRGPRVPRRHRHLVGARFVGLVASDAMDRREFLRLGAIAGAAAALAQCSSGSAKAARLPASTTTTTPRLESVLDGAAADSGIDTVVVAMMENRSFDSYFGWLARDEQYLEQGRSRYGANVRDQRQLVPDSSRARRHAGQDVPARTAATSRNRGAAAATPIPATVGTTGRAERDGGFLAAGQRQRRVRAFVLRGRRPSRSTTSSRVGSPCATAGTRRCSGRRIPNREYLLSAQSGGHKNNYLPLAEGGFKWPTIVDRLAAANVERRRVLQRLPALLLWGARMNPYIRKIDALRHRRGRGQAAERLVRHAARSSAPTAPTTTRTATRAPRRAFVRDAFAAFSKSPQWERGPVRAHLRRVGRLLRPRRAADARPTTAPSKNDAGELRAGRIPRADRARIAVRAAGFRRPHAVRPHVDPAVPRVAVPRRSRTRSGRRHRQVVPHRARSPRQQPRREPATRKARSRRGIRRRR